MKLHLCIFEKFLNVMDSSLKNTHSVTVDDICYHTKNVSQGIKYAYLIADMPINSFKTKKQALANALKITKTGITDDLHNYCFKHDTACSDVTHLGYTGGKGYDRTPHGTADLDLDITSCGTLVDIVQTPGFKNENDASYPPGCIYDVASGEIWWILYHT